MLKLHDFYHLPRLDTLLDQLIRDQPGLIVLAGLDPRPRALPGEPGLLASGRTTFFRILVNELLSAHTSAQAMVISADRQLLHVPRQLRSRVSKLPVDLRRPYTAQIGAALAQNSGLLVLDRLTSENLQPALQAAAAGAWVISQIDTFFHGAQVLQELIALGATAQQLVPVRWVLTMRRLHGLCPHCATHSEVHPAQLELLQRRFTELWPAQTPQFHQARGCERCNQSGHFGELTIFDVLHRDDQGDLFSQPSQLAFEEYVFQLVLEGRLGLNDLLDLEGSQLRQTHQLLGASEQALASTNTQLQRKLAELEAANATLQQRTAALIALQEVSRALSSPQSLDELAQQICRHARELCGGDRVILFLLRDESYAVLLGASGWEPWRLPRRVPLEQIFSGSDEPQPTDRLPPGITPLHPDVTGVEIRCGVIVPLVAQGRRVGQMIVHSTRKNRFLAGEIALLRSFAGQAAVSIQRAELIEQLQQKIAELEAAQAALVQKERLEREMELAREVQQSILPRRFPNYTGFRFAADNRPARRVGGDFYDLFELDQQRFGLLIADVSGKGMPAALYMALSRSLLLAEARRDPSPRSVVLQVNELLRELGDPNMFVTVFYGIIDRSTRRLTYCRAGHDYPLLLRNGVCEVLRSPGLLLGSFDQIGEFLTEEQLTLQPGDRLLLYTDGLTDQPDPAGTMPGQDGLAALVSRHAGLNAADLCNALFNALDQHRANGEQFDDMTVLVVEVTGT